jgi:hypothetical protein
MKKVLIILALSLSAPLVFALPSVAVVDFDSGSFCTVEEALVMAGLFRNEMVRSGRADVVDRRHLDAVKSEIKFQMSDWTDPAKIKQAGRMLGADYLVFGTFGIMGGTGYLHIEMTDVETARILHSSRVTLNTWREFDSKVGPLAKEFTGRLPAENIFNGTWTADIPHDGIIDAYTITFTGPGRCTVSVTSIPNSGDFGEKTAEAAGTYSFDGDILKITANFRNSAIPHITAVQWSSVISIGAGNRSFNMLAKPTSAASNQVRVTFTKE